jgi:hypothetical protein
MKKKNIFISWSGDRSKLIADALYEWLPMVLQSAKPWMSGANIEKGSRGLLEMAKALEGIKVGISCLTPENLVEPWILYEAGCLSKTVDDTTHLCTYLLGGLRNQDIQPPLSQFQHTRADKEDTRHLVHSLNKALGEDEPLNEKTLDTIFDRCWTDLELKLKALPSAPNPVVKRTTDDMLAEILEFTRSQSNRESVPVFLTSPNMVSGSLADPSYGSSLKLFAGSAYPAVAGGSIFGDNSRLMSVSELLSGTKTKPAANTIAVPNPSAKKPPAKK